MNLSHNDPLPSSDHVARSCGFVKYETVDGNIKVGGAGFQLQDKDFGRLSVNWLEYFENLTQDIQINKIREIYINKGRTLRSKGIFAVLNIGQTIDNVYTTTGKKVNFVYDPVTSPPHEPKEVDPSHSAIVGIPSPDALGIEDCIAESVCCTYPEMGPN